MKIYGVLFLGLFLVLHQFAYGQAGNEKCRKIPAHKELYIVDSLTIIPGSIKIIPANGITLEPDLDNGRIKVLNEGHADSLNVCYNVIPFALNQRYYHRSISEYDSGFYLMNLLNKPYQAPVEIKDELFHSEGLTKSGAISRGISFGNNQSLYVNSALNLQMDGRLSPALNVRASITDQNIPYQPEGNTVLVQDFDRIYIELYNDKFSLLGGDMMLNSGDSWFLKYRRNVMGARFLTHYRTGRYGEASSSIAISESKGRFSSFTIPPIDGVLGPYRIYGPGQENYIIILANSEKIFLDGKLLQRGYDNDYMIDYNNAEVTFTSRVLITRYSRIVVEFQYNDQSYGRSLVAVQHEQKIGKVNIHVNYYREKDDPSRPFALELSDNQKALLQGVRSLGNYATIPGVDSVGYQPSKVLYAMADTVNANGKKISIYKYTVNPDSALYQVYFSEVGTNKGNYQKRIMSSGLSVYDWVFPTGGIPQGDYEPIRKIPLPNKVQMLDVGASGNLSTYEKLSGEMAISEFNNNLFSASRSNDITGNAVRIALESKNRPVSRSKNLFYNGGVNLEYSGKGFKSVDRYLPVEYDRDWTYNPADDSTSTADLILNVSNGLHGKKGYLDHQLSRRVKNNFIDGWQNTIIGALTLSKLNLSGDLYMMNNKMNGQHSEWIRYHFLSQYNLGYFIPGYQFTSDKNVIYESRRDSVTGSAMNYDEHLFFIKNSDSLKTRFNIQYSIRKDMSPQSGEIINDNKAYTLGFNLDHGSPASGKIGIGLYLRKLNMMNGNGKGDKSLNGKIDWDQPMFRDNLRSEFSYSIGSGRELKREYTYIEVPNGQGTHTWRDDNGDGIKQLSEFYPAINPDERNYIKIFIPTDNYVLAFDNMLNYRLTAGFPGKWLRSAGITRLLSRFSNTLSVTADQKNSTFGIMNRLWDNAVHSFNPDVLSEHGRLRNTLYFNRQNPGFGMEATYDMVTGKSLYSEGFEGRSVKTLMLNSRMNFQREYAIQMGYSGGQILNGSDYLSGRNYAIHSSQINSSISWQPTNFYRLTANILHAYKKNVLDILPEMSKINEGGMDFRISKANDKAIDCGFRFTRIDFTGDKNSPAGYELLNGLQPGNNITWSVNWQQKLINGLQVNLIYEGRKSGELRVINTGSMQVTALF